MLSPNKMGENVSTRLKNVEPTTGPIIFVRGKIPDSGLIEEAERRKLPLLASDKLMFDTCGILYSNGLKGGKSLLEVKDGSANNIQPVVSD